MYVVTGGAGFIGANIVRGLNDRGIDDVLVVDHLKTTERFKNVIDCTVADRLDKRDFLQSLVAGRLSNELKAIFHQGACSDTMEENSRYMMENNYEYSKSLLHFCQQEKVPLIYASSASVYGAGPIYCEDGEYEAPLNVYGRSKLLFDQYVRRVLSRGTAQIAGLRYFNVYGEGEWHKGRMASVAFQFFNQYRQSGQVNLFRGSGGYEDGEQRRDFISVEDVVAVNMFFLDHPDKSGIFNVGTGRSQSFNEVAMAVINSIRRVEGTAALPLEQLQDEGIIQYVDFPNNLESRYQSFTQADIGALRAAGFSRPFLTVEEGVERYVQRLPTNANERARDPATKHS
ncbi:MAG: ADP-glyceromanno-heptose 6-epimerase [Acidiferrobacterales bacterium]